MPSQKLGVAMPSTAIVPAARSRKRPRLSAATTPSGMPTSMASSNAQGMIASVFGRRERNTSTAGWRMRSDVPRSPCSALPMNATYCLKSEPSRPSASIRRARSSAVASSGSIRSTGLPVSRPRKNTTVATRTRSMRPCNSRRAMKPPISGYPQSGSTGSPIDMSRVAAITSSTASGRDAEYARTRHRARAGPGWPRTRRPSLC